MPDSQKPFMAHHNHCIACGPSHAIPSLSLDFNWLDPNTLHTQFNVTDAYQGYDRLLHGGVATMLLDAAMTHFLLEREVAAVTIDLNVEFKKPIIVGQTVDIYASEERCRHGIHWMKSGIYNNNRALATAKARFKVPSYRT